MERRRLRATSLLRILGAMLIQCGAVLASKKGELASVDRRLQAQFRVNAPSFRIEVSPTPLALSPDQLDAMHNAVERMASAELNAQTEFTFRYLLFGDISLEFDSEAEKSIVSFPSGVAAFWGASSAFGPSSGEMLQWITAGVELGLVDELQANPALAFIETALIVQDGGAAPVQRGATNASSSTNAGLIAGMSVAAAACIILLGLFVKRHRSDKVSDRVIEIDENDLKAAKLNETAESSFENPPPYAVEGTDQISLSDSFTICTEDVAENQSVMGTSLAGAAPSVVSTESFEKDRQLNVRKDMLTSPWSGRMPAAKASGPTESVLEPSHFSAAKERSAYAGSGMIFQSPHGGEEVVCRAGGPGLV